MFILKPQLFLSSPSVSHNISGQSLLFLSISRSNSINIFLNWKRMLPSIGKNLSLWSLFHWVQVKVDRGVLQQKKGKENDKSQIWKKKKFKNWVLQEGYQRWEGLRIPRVRIAGQRGEPQQELSGHPSSTLSPGPSLHLLVCKRRGWARRPISYSNFYSKSFILNSKF